MLLLTTAALPQLREHAHPNLGRLITPRHFPRLTDTLAEGWPVAADNDCFRGLVPEAVCRMCQAIVPWPPMRSRIWKAWPGLRPTRTTTTMADGTVMTAAPVSSDHLPRLDPKLLFVTVPDVVGDATATLGLFRFWHQWLVHLPLAYVIQDGAERVGVPWDAPGLQALFIGGSTAFKLGPQAAALVREAQRRGLHVHMGRVSSLRRVRYAQSIGCDSIDGTIFARWRNTYLQQGLGWVSQPPQMRLLP